MKLNGGGRLLACGVCMAAAVSAEAASGWLERATLEGDLRLRHESIRVEPGADDDRERYRARFGFRVDAAGSVEFGLRLATGEGSPVSTNLDFGEGFSFDNIRIDRAYVGWSVNDALTLTFGKMKNPLERAGDTPLLWDSDLNLEGIATVFESGRFFGTAGAFRLDYRDDGAESRLYAAQAGTRFDVAESSTLSAGIGWFDYTDIAGNSPLFGDDANGNSVDAAGNYLNDFDIFEFFAEYETTVGGWPVVVFGEWARNTRAAAAGTAWAAGVKAGTAEGAGSTEWSWEWRDTGADALVGTLTDSDLADGNTDSRGHAFQGSYMVTDHIALAATLIFSEYGRFNDSPTDFDRVMIDIEFSF